MTFSIHCFKCRSHAKGHGNIRKPYEFFEFKLLKGQYHPVCRDGKCKERKEPVDYGTFGKKKN